MIGDRYGWVPLSYAVEKGEFELLLDLMYAAGTGKDGPSPS